MNPLLKQLCKDILIDQLNANNIHISELQILGFWLPENPCRADFPDQQEIYNRASKLLAQDYDARISKKLGKPYHTEE